MPVSRAQFAEEVDDCAGCLDSYGKLETAMRRSFHPDPRVAAEVLAAEAYLQDLRLPLTGTSLGPNRHGNPCPHWGLVILFLEKAKERLFEDRHAVRDLVQMAVEISENLGGDSYSEMLVWDLRARVLGELANAYRLLDNGTKSDSCFATAFEYYSKGSRSARLWLRLQSLLAGSHSSRGSFYQALLILDQATKLAAHGPQEEILLELFWQQAQVHYKAGRTQDALRDIETAIASLPEESSKRIRFALLFHRILYLLDLGFTSEARQQLLVLPPAPPSLRVESRHLWTEGRLLRAEGRPSWAIPPLEKSIETFKGEGDLYRAALAMVDLSAVYLELGRIEEAERLAASVHPLFLARKASTEVLMVARLLGEAANSETLSVPMLDEVARYLQRI
ncbi:MAG: hypothetical protein K0U98_07240 [Deltaproteobacteria bacterium]|nr:hypothetical protein [Deltaproteobacteria bacterium]